MKIAEARLQAALRALGIENREEVASVVLKPNEITVYRQELTDGKVRIDPVTDGPAVYSEVFDVDRTKNDADDGTGLAYAHVTLVHNDGVVYSFHVTDQAEYLANVDINSVIDVHLYGIGSATKSPAVSSVSEPMPAEPEETA